MIEPKTARKRTPPQALRGARRTRPQSSRKTIDWAKQEKPARGHLETRGHDQGEPLLDRLRLDVADGPADGRRLHRDERSHRRRRSREGDVTLRRSDEEDSDEAHQHARDHGQAQGRAPAEQRLGEGQPQGEGRDEESGDSARNVALGRHDEAVADPHQEDAHDRRVQPLLARGRPPVSPEPREGEKDGACDHETHGRRDVGRHVLDHKPDAHVCRAPDDVDHAQSEVGELFSRDRRGVVQGRPDSLFHRAWGTP